MSNNQDSQGNSSHAAIKTSECGMTISDGPSTALASRINADANKGSHGPTSQPGESPNISQLHHEALAHSLNRSTVSKHIVLNQSDDKNAALPNGGPCSEGVESEDMIVDDSD